MTKSIRKVVSIICVVAILMSLCVVSMINTTSAFKASDNSVGNALFLDFENNKGIADTTMGGTDRSNMYVTDPADPNNTVVRLHGETNAAQGVELGNANGSGYFNLSPNTTYKVTFKYKYAKGSYRGGNLMNVNLYRSLGVWASGKKIISASANYVVKAADNPETTTVGSGNQRVNILAADTEWFTYTRTFTTPDFTGSDNKNRLYINMPTEPQSTPHGNMTVYLDDIMVDIVNE